MLKKTIGLFLLVLLCGCAAQMHASKGWGFIDKNMPDEAIKEFELSYGSGPLPGYYLGMYDSYLLKQDLERAVEYLFEGIKKYPDDLFLHHALGLYYLKVSRPKDFDKAIFYFERCKTIDKHHSITKELDQLIKEAKKGVGQN